MQSLKEKLMDMLGLKTDKDVTEEEKAKANARLNTKKRQINSGNRSVRDQLDTWKGDEEEK